jgi:ethanolamine utilization protein EutN
MRVAEVIGTVTLNRVHPTLKGYRLVIGVPYSLNGLRKNQADGEDYVIVDPLGAGIGNQIGVSEGGEAAVPFHPEKKPVDAYCACILDQIALSDQRLAIS